MVFHAPGLTEGDPGTEQLELELLAPVTGRGVAH